MNKILTYKNGGVSLPVCQLPDGSIKFDAEQSGIGLGICEVAASGHVVVKWTRLNKYLSIDTSVDKGIRRGDFITESQFYKLAIKANNATAEKFQNWVTEDVLPSIRKHGAYMTDETIEQVLTDPDTIIKLATQLKNERAERVAAEHRAEALQPKADYTDKMLANPGLETTSVIAKNYGYSTREFNKLLHGLGIQYKQGKTWLLYAKYQDKGYTHIEPFPYTDSQGMKQVRNTMKWTQKGQQFLYEFLELRGIMPLVEQAV